MINQAYNRSVPGLLSTVFQAGKFGTQHNRQCEPRQGFNLITLLAESFQCETKNRFIMMTVWQTAVHHRELTDLARELRLYAADNVS